MKFSLYISIFCLFVLANIKSQAQGCVAVRNMSSSCGLASEEHNKGTWQLSVNYRYFRSYKHFRGKEEEKNRVEQGTQVINNDNSFLMGVSYTATERLSFAATIPYISIDRSSLYEHYGNTPGNPRFHTQASGFGDIRVSGYYAALQKSKFYLTLGLGVKLPTGNYNTKDHFHKKNTEGGDSLVYKVVDQSIQLGDGGLGFAPEFDFSVLFNKSFSLYGTGLYLFNPRNTNGIKRSPNLTSNIPLSNEFSVVDQYLFRLGARYNLKRFHFGLGGRMEGIPSEDLIGKSDGFRRPGYIISVEPAIGYSTGKHSLVLNLPVALERNRVQNTIDKERTKQTGTHTIGDAAFADYLMSFTYAYKIAKQ